MSKKEYRLPINIKKSMDYLLANSYWSPVNLKGYLIPNLNLSLFEDYVILI